MKVTHISQSRDSTTTTERPKLGYGLIRSSVAVSLSENIQQDNSSAKFRYGSDFEIEWLPSLHELGNWAMPGDGESK
jgi:hypothetical protein